MIELSDIFKIIFGVILYSIMLVILGMQIGFDLGTNSENLKKEAIKRGFAIETKNLKGENIFIWKSLK